jgi:hypothetical protein
MKGLATDLLRSDFDKTYLVDYNMLLSMIQKKVQVPESLRQDTSDL